MKLQPPETIVCTCHQQFTIIQRTPCPKCGQVFQSLQEIQARKIEIQKISNHLSAEYSMLIAEEAIRELGMRKGKIYIAPKPSLNVKLTRKEKLNLEAEMLLRDRRLLK